MCGGMRTCGQFTLADGTEGEAVGAEAIEEKEAWRGGSVPRNEHDRVTATGALLVRPREEGGAVGRAPDAVIVDVHVDVGT